MRFIPRARKCYKVGILVQAGKGAGRSCSNARRNATRSAFSRSVSFSSVKQVEEFDGVFQGKQAPVMKVRRRVLNSAKPLDPENSRRIGYVHVRRQFKPPAEKAFVEWLKCSVLLLRSERRRDRCSPRFHREFDCLFFADELSPQSIISISDLCGKNIPWRKSDLAWRGSGQGRSASLPGLPDSP
jgi:hypothetical protein